MLDDAVAAYLEKSFEAALKREMEQEENVLRSLPFFATSIGFLLTFVGFLLVHLPPPALTPFSVGVYGGLFGLCGILLGLIVLLHRATRRRPLLLPAEETELLVYAEELRTSRQARGAGAAETGSADAAALRRLAVQQLARSAQVYRANNDDRLRARDGAFRLLFAAIALAICVMLSVAVHSLSGGTL